MDRVEKPHEWRRVDVCDLRAVCEVYRCNGGIQGCVGIGLGRDEDWMQASGRVAWAAAMVSGKL